MMATQVIGDIALILVLSSLLGAAARRCGQPAVIGQILVGLLLGPSLLGRLPGHLMTRLFPQQALPYLTVLSQVAIVIFMFAVGYEIDFGSLRAHGRAVPLIAASALLVPMGMGAGLAWLGRPLFAAVGEQHAWGRSFYLFMAVAMAITALPVLAAILRDRDLSRSTAGIIAIAASGLMDVTAWLVLAAALISLPHSASRPFLVTLLLAAGFVAGMVFVVRPALHWWINRPESMLTYQVPVALALAMGSAWLSGLIGLHAVFGGFLAGLVMPGRGRVPDADVLRFAEESGGLLLPLFFVVTGLSLNMGALGGNAVILLGLAFVVGNAAKLGPAYAASRLSGLDPRPSAQIAALLNTRGLTEIIALKVGLDAGIINQTLFTVLVIVALATTVMTGPLLTLIGRGQLPSPVRPALLDQEPAAGTKSPDITAGL